MAWMMQDDVVKGKDDCIKAMQAETTHVKSDSRAVGPLQIGDSDLMGHLHLHEPEATFMS
jgi:hypothetical protein